MLCLFFYSEDKLWSKRNEGIDAKESAQDIGSGLYI
jgi:hypothetical protein